MSFTGFSCQTLKSLVCNIIETSHRFLREIVKNYGPSKNNTKQKT